MQKCFLTICVLLLTAISIHAAEAEAKKVEFTGKLKTGIMAIGGETTGTIIETKDGKYELQLGKNAELRAKADKLNGKQVTVTGTLVVRPGVEVKERKIVTVATLTEAAK